MYNNTPDRDPNPPENRTRLVTIHWKAEVWGSTEVEMEEGETPEELEQWFLREERFDVERRLRNESEIEDAVVEIESVEGHAPDPFEYMED